MPLDSSKFTRFAQFHTTRWSAVVRAQSPATGAADESLESLCRQYWPPLYAYVRGRGHPPHEAQDLTQEFFARLLEKARLAAVDRSQGKLRLFLLTAIKRFLANEWDRSQAARRGGLHATASMDNLTSLVEVRQQVLRQTPDGGPPAAALAKEIARLDALDPVAACAAAVWLRQSPPAPRELVRSSGSPPAENPAPPRDIPPAR